MKGKEMRDGRDCRKKGGKVDGEDGKRSDEMPDEKDSSDSMPRYKKGGKVDGEKAKMHMGRAKRASGGGVGADKAPLTGANRTSNPKNLGLDRSGCP